MDDTEDDMEVGSPHWDTEVMGPEDTQVQTQKLEQAEFESLRKGRHNSGLSEDDASDVFCVLHPASPAAFRIVKETAISRPQHVLQNERWRRSSKIIHPTNYDEDQLLRARVDEAQDLALRFSSEVVDLDNGFAFGRNSQTCDINLDMEDKQKRVSNTHFRIFINDHGILMLEDVSSNGTIVDQKTIGGRMRKGTFPGTVVSTKTHMLCSGTVVEIYGDAPDDTIKFVLRIPPRDGSEAEYAHNFQDYMCRRAVTNVHKRQGLPIPAGGIKNLMIEHVTGQPKHQSTINPPGVNPHYGMHWNGGDKYTCTGIVGHGAFATVYQIATRWNGELYAAKELEKKRFIKQGKLDERLANELRIMKSIRHENIVDYIDYAETPTHLYIIMEYIRCGDLQGYMQPRTGVFRTLPEHESRVMTKQILDALRYLHKNNITHRDIKPDNILICSEQPFLVKLTDFGLSKMVRDTTTFLKTFCGTLLYCAPEVFPFDDADFPQRTPKRRRTDTNRRMYSHLVDVWSYAAVLWYVLCGKPAFEGITDGNGRAMFHRIMSTTLDTTPLRENGISDECIDLLIKMLDVDPTTRYTEDECLVHPWLDDSTQQAPLSEMYDNGKLKPIPEGEEEVDCSQLTIHDRTEEVSSDPSSQSDRRRLKRWKGESFLAMRELTEVPSSPEESEVFAEMMGNPLRGNALEAAREPSQQQAFHQPSAPTEAGTRQMSILRSSGVFGDEWEGIPEPDDTEDGSEEEAAIRQMATDDSSDNNASSSRPRLTGLDGTDDMQFDAPSPNSLYKPPTLERQQQHQLESMVRDLKMVSPSTSSSSAHVIEDPTTPKAKSGRVAVTTPRGAQQQGGAEEVTPRPRPVPTFNRLITVPVPPSFWYDPHDPSTHNIEYATRKMNEERLGTLNESSFANVAAQPSLPSTTYQSVTLSAEPKDPSQKTISSTSNKENEDDSINITSLSPALSIPSFPAVPSAVHLSTRSPRLFGRLKSTSNSWANITLDLSQRYTSWGRNSMCTIVHRDSQDTRIPKIGLELYFHAPGIDVVDKAGQDWIDMDGLCVILQTQSNKGVWVNGVRLLPRGEARHSQPRASLDAGQIAGEQESSLQQPQHEASPVKMNKLFGELFQGDEVAIGAPAAPGPDGREIKPLKFICEFFVGRGVARRKTGDGEPKFVIEEEREVVC